MQSLLHSSVRSRYPFLNKSWNEESYLPADYYNAIIKNYIFNGETDLEIFENALAQLKLTLPCKALELGCGSGRVTERFVKIAPQVELDILDLSEQMLTYTAKHFSAAKIILSDSIDYLTITETVYDFVYSLWSFSHSLQQQIRHVSHNDVKNRLKKFFKKNIKPNGHFFLIHFDSMSEEQNVTMPLWEKLFPKTVNLNEQSPSFIIINKALKELADEKIIIYSCEQKTGNAIIYKTMEEALEVYMNFHLESQLNTFPDAELESIVDYLNDYFSKYQLPDGSISIKPGCFVIQVRKL